MELILKKKPQNVTIIEGFPGIGLVGSIATEYLVNHLDTEEIGQIMLKDTSPIVAIHEQKLIKPITLYYCKKFNLVLVHAIAPVKNVEWKIGEGILDAAKQMKAKQMISIEGVFSQKEPSETIYFYANNETTKKALEKAGLEQLKEGIVVGVTAALMSQKGQNSVSLFSETHMNMPDARAAAKIIKALDAYLGLDVDFGPLLDQAAEFEEKIKGMLQQQGQAAKAQEQHPAYFG